MSEQSRPQVVLVNRCIVQEEDKLLLVKRADGDTFNAGLWEFPGGKLDEGQDLSTALERELEEETGLRVQATSPLVYADSFVIEKGKYAGLPYVVLVSLGRIASGSLKLSEEHTDYAWDTYEEALERSLTAESKKALRVLGATALKRH